VQEVTQAGRDATPPDVLTFVSGQAQQIFLVGFWGVLGSFALLPNHERMPIESDQQGKISLLLLDQPIRNSVALTS
jgi:hypothetical protein